jgi:acetyl esterase/lipase
MMPQAGSAGLLEDVKAAYGFARHYDVADSAERKVIVAGASAGFFLATLTGHHCQPPPIALLSITGITTFRHPFFNTSVLLTPKPITDAQVQKHVTEPVSVGVPEAGDATVFSLEKLLPSGTKNPDFKPAQPPVSGNSEAVPRGCLYDYWLYKNAFLDLVGDVDPGYDWAKIEDGKAKLDIWPTTIIIQGNDDYDVDFKVSSHMVEALGEDKVKLCVADGQGHLFEATKFLEDDVAGMDAVRTAVQHLDQVVLKHNR